MNRLEHQAPGDAPTRRRQVLLPLASGALCGTLVGLADDPAALARRLGDFYDQLLGR